MASAPRRGWSSVVGTYMERRAARVVRRGTGVGGAGQGRGRGVARGGGVPLEVEPLEALEAHGVRPPVGEAHGRRAGAGVEPVRDDGAASGDEDLGAWYGGGCEVAPR